jgi:hypothetical protein
VSRPALRVLGARFSHAPPFVSSRGDYAFLGFGWSGCGVRNVFPEILRSDFGVPTAFCAESSPGIFTREWTKATVQMDCTTYKGSFVMKE